MSLTKTELRIIYSERTWCMEWSDSLDEQLEESFIKNPEFFTDEIFYKIQFVVILWPEARLEDILGLLTE